MTMLFIYKSPAEPCEPTRMSMHGDIHSYGIGFDYWFCSGRPKCIVSIIVVQPCHPSTHLLKWNSGSSCGSELRHSLLVIVVGTLNCRLMTSNPDLIHHVLSSTSLDRLSWTSLEDRNYVQEFRTKTIRLDLLFGKFKKWRSKSA